MSVFSPSKSSPARPRRGFFVRWIGGFFRGLMVLSFVLMLAYLCFYRGDEAPPDDSDLLVRPSPVPDAQNGLAQLSLLPAQVLDGSEDSEFARQYAAATALPAERMPEFYDLVSGRVRDDAYADAFLAQARPALAPLDSILQLPYFQDKDWEDPRGHRVSFMPLTVSETLALSVLRYQQTGDFVGAVAEIARLRRLATRLAETPTGQQQLTFARFAAQFAAEQTAGILNDPAVPASALTALASLYATEIPWQKASQRSLFSGYRGIVSWLKELQAEPWSQIGTWAKVTAQENTTRREAAAIFRQARDALAGPYAQLPPDPPELIPGKIYPWWEYLRPNSFGRYVILMGAEVTSHQSQGYNYQIAADDRLIETGLALRLYYDEHRALPPNLAGLVPQYLPSVPLDPFDGKPLRYDAKKGLVYSVGISLKDQDGSFGVVHPKFQTENEVPLESLDQPTLVLEFQKYPSAPAQP